MKKCKACGFWDNIESTDMGICRRLFAYEQRGYAPIQIVPFCVERTREAETHMFFGCVHFEEKEQGPFSIVKNDAQTYHFWRMVYGGQEEGPTFFHQKSVAEMWRNWLNEKWTQKEEKPQRSCSDCKHDDEDLLFCGKHAFVCGRWAQKGKEPPGKNCPDCTSFPCWTHQFFTGHDRFCCDKFERRECKNCSSWISKHGYCTRDDHPIMKGKETDGCHLWKAMLYCDKSERRSCFTCKTCSFWKDKHPFSDGMWGACEYAEMKKSLPVHCGKAIAGGAFSDTKNCTFHTREDFGCNQWTNL